MPSTLAQAFDSRNNSIGFLRWLMAFLVIFSHAGPLGGFYGSEDLGTQISSEQSLGGVAVAGFFFFSGFLITKSRMGRSTIFRYFWRRGLRIFPAFWVALLVTAFVLAPIAFQVERGTIDGYWNATSDSPFTYFVNNMWLSLGQRNIAGMGSSIPLGSILHSYDWNGSAWTLLYEFRAYIMVGALGLFAIFAHRFVATIVGVGIIILNMMTWGGVGNLPAFHPALQNPFNVMFFAPFALGMLFALWADKIPIDDRLAVFAMIIALVTYDIGGWNIYGQYGFCYVLMWFAVRVTKLSNWEKYGDFSYGIYIFAWPLMQFGAFFGLQNAGWLIYHVVIVAASHVMAFFSWHFIEKPAMSLKNWTPRPVQWGIDKLTPLTDRIKGVLVDPRFSSSNFAKKLRAESGTKR
jgi:peptidoglycan/LPS O-acetylase OafA/YrhL